MLPAEEAQDIVNAKEKSLDSQSSLVVQQMIGRSRSLLSPTGRSGFVSMFDYAIILTA